MISSFKSKFNNLVYNGKFIEDISGTDASGMEIKETAKLDTFHFSSGGTAIGSMYMYDINRDDEGYVLKITFNFINDDDPIIVRLDDNKVNELMDMIKEYEVNSWDGFHMVNNSVLDGGGFSTNIIFDDGSQIDASGSNTYPNGYGAFESALNEFFLEYSYDFQVEHDLIYVEPVFYPLNMGVATSYIDKDTYVSRLRTVHLTKEDAEKYPIIAESLGFINEKAMKDFNENNSVIVNVVRADTNVLSLVIYQYDPRAVNENSEDFKGEYGSIETYNLLSDTGEVIGYGDIVQAFNRNEQIRLIRNEIPAKYPNLSIEDLNPYYEKWLESTNNLKVAVAPEWVHIFFNPGEIADKSEGLIQVLNAYTTKFSFNEHLFLAPKNYTSLLCAPLHLYGNMDHDEYGLPERVRLRFDEDQGRGDFYMMYLEDGNIYLIQDDAWIVNKDYPEDGLKEGENSRDLFVYSLENAKLEVKTDIPYCFSEISLDDLDAKDREKYGDCLLVRLMPTNPKSFYLDSKDEKKVEYSLESDGTLKKVE